ncbi:branched-chain amino acid dehydrogenase [Megasphaera cerevisiae DSM 20462]|uniref:Branched-chain amino acid dehydrogenase n=1 Tax=Megasphaera cerevisiae DSM 20462 TaxID=1122219 RepID=A0A0J6ZR67_9FIRM|nr:CoA transferase subunit A [Megasphaera cerevisiae]KMO87446.1 branched-chain amino acid dehydrogenase [Megasphaera cerevisiae DSM 20462]MCI1750763.1 CoA transferase subunit A [Megasphaera cerevisiae]OKY53940.1 branched-chain amino acid dehydrogenase [Megasphaera cerevisiae]SJZ36518.1 acetate CoA/acetoacetate CoA-transferase alpha subunit [Megasphaera cerevisiae DSM 20462]
MNKLLELDQAMHKVQDGATIMIGGFLGIGVPLKCIEKIAEKGVGNLTVISIVNANPAGNFDLAVLFQKRQIKKFITSHTGTCPEAVQQYKAGEIEIEYYPMGNFIEKIRAAGAGLGGVLSATGIGTLMEENKQKISVHGKEYLVETPLRADISFIKGFRADEMGNIEYRGIAVNSNPVMATAADYTVAEVNDIVRTGDIDPNRVGTPGIFVDAVVQGYSLKEQQERIGDLWKNAGFLKNNP